MVDITTETGILAARASRAPEDARWRVIWRNTLPFIVVFGLPTGEAAGTSMVAVGVLTIPTLAAHWTLGHIDWSVAIAFAAGVVPGSLVGARVALRVSAPKARCAFGLLLVGFAVFFLAYQLV